METLEYLEPSIKLVEPFHQLAPYMCILNEGDFSQINTAKFADLVLSSSESSGCESHFDQQMATGVEFAQREASKLAPQQQPALDQHSCCQWSSSSASSAAGSLASSPSAAPSVASEFRYLDDLSYSSSSYYNSSCCSSYPTSVASSEGACESENWLPVNSSAEKNLSSSPEVPKSNRSYQKRGRNANSAERYRRKLKGSSRNLFGDLDQELSRNKKLKRQISAKLALYSEFVALLAEKTQSSDCRLASIGEHSLASVLATVVAPNENSDLELEEDSLSELSGHLMRFRQIIGKCK